jgi:hypothetical protein
VTVVFVAVTILAAGANVYSATLDFVRYQPVLDAMTKAGVPHSLLPLLGALKLAGAVGLVAGIGLPWAGVAAAVGLVLFFLAAIGVHLRARDYALGLPLGFLALAVAALALGLAQ